MDNNYEVHEIPMAEIHSDQGFNCRGFIAPMDVHSLAKDIDQNGLQFPIAVQPAEEIAGELPDGKCYRIVAGHRRHRAFEILRRDVIPAMIKRGLTEVQARVFNLSENLQRAELNILQEAKALLKLKELGLVQEAAAEAVGRTRSWVQIRYNLLELPEVIQEEAAAGLLNQAQIKQIYGLKGTSDDPTKVQEAQFAAVRAIKNALLRGEKGISVAKKPEADPYKKKRRAKNEVQDMIHHIGKSGPGFGFATRCLAWANGEINTAELYLEIKHQCQEIGKSYVIPVAALEQQSAEVATPGDCSAPLSTESCT
jgi:ParB/RepB/Spo0J family partition protein